MAGIVGLLAKDVCTCHHLLHDLVLLLFPRLLNSLLNDIVSIPVLHHLGQGRVQTQLFVLVLANDLVNQVVFDG